jgi:flavorubredoxin/flavin reductase (DIM6/NTAB) family NADH-FMN oxidoreductase RutF/rubredoxin
LTFTEKRAKILLKAFGDDNMHCTRKITDDLYWVGADNRRLAMFEGVYSVPDGVSFNSYLCLDIKTTLFDTVDATVSEQFFENIEYVLHGRKLDYLVVHHMEPDHSATLSELLRRYPDITVICNKQIATMIKNFFNLPDLDERAMIVNEFDTFCTGMHTFKFIFAPMVHWPEVMVTYDETNGVLFSADAFGTFGALNGAIYADEVDFDRDYLDEARRYYTNIVGKYGPQVQALLNKAATVDIKYICPLHGFVWRRNISYYLDKYDKWSSYTPEETGVCIVYATIYGHTENAAQILSTKLREKGIKTVMYDTSVIPASDIVSACFKYSHIVFASSTYNAGIFVTMEAVVNDLTAHNFQNRNVTVIENGSWAPAAGNLIRAAMLKCKDIKLTEKSLSIRSSVKENDLERLVEIADEIASGITVKTVPEIKPGEIENSALFKLSYGLYLLSAKADGKDNACIINAAMMITDTPKQIAFTVNKANATHDMLISQNEFTISVLEKDVPFEVVKHFGYSSGKTVNKFDDLDYVKRASNGTLYTDKYANAVIAGEITNRIDCGTHTMFIAQITEAFELSLIPSVTYEHYQNHIKPAPKLTKDAPKKGWVCKVCGYVYEGEELPHDFVCPICKHGVDVFEKIG